MNSDKEELINVSAISLCFLYILCPSCFPFPTVLPSFVSNCFVVCMCVLHYFDSLFILFSELSSDIFLEFLMGFPLIF